MELGKGEALTSFLDDSGTPSIVERTLITPPSARVGPVNPDERKAIIGRSPVKGKYDQALDAESAFEVIQARAKAAAVPPEEAEAHAQASGGGIFGGLSDALGGIFGTSPSSRGKPLSTGQYVAREVTRSVVNRVAGQIAADFGRSIGGKTGGTIGRAIVRGSLGGMMRRR
jgi:hypothetical protein